VTQANPQPIPIVTVAFPNGNEAQLAFAGPRRPPEALLAAVGLTGSRPVLLVIGGADSLDPAIEIQLRELLDRGAIRAAGETGATVLDGGTSTGVMATLGRAAAVSDVSVPLVGVAPAEKVTYPGDERQLPDGRTPLEPNHTHFLLANSADWGGETTLLFDIVDRLAEGQPAAVILAGGGPIAMREVRAAAQRGMPIIIVGGSGGIADDLAARAGGQASAADAFDQIVKTADLSVIPIDADPADLAEITARLLRVDESLRDAWTKQGAVSEAARRQQRDFRIGQGMLLVLGTGLTVLVVAKSVLDSAGKIPKDSMLAGVFYVTILAIPILVSVLTAAAASMRPGNRWILLRGTSEGIKREIYRYRARAGIYSHAQTRDTPRETKLARVVGSAMGSLMRTEVNRLALRRSRKSSKSETAHPAAPGVDNRMSRLTPEEYIHQRIDLQVEWYDSRTEQLERQARWLRWLAFGFGGIGTLLAATGFQIWVAVTTALVGVYTTILEAWQIETTVSLYNQASTDLGSIRAWWYALPTADRDSQQTIDRLVDQSERIMRAEHAGWVQEMQDAMTQLRLEQASDAAGDRVGSGAGSSGKRGGRGKPPERPPADAVDETDPDADPVEEH